MKITIGFLSVLCFPFVATAQVDEEEYHATETLDEIIIDTTVNRVDLKSTEMSVNQMTAEEIKKIPVVLGETDVLKTLLLLPGVTNAGEGASGFNVRGGGSDQNLILLDQAIVYGSSHLYGFFSVFNNDVVKNLKLYKGGIPATYGSRASSVLEINQRNGDFQNFKSTGGIGLLTSRLAIEGPIIKDKMSFIAAGRGSYAHLFLKLTDLKSTAFFYDFNAKWSYIVRPNNEWHASLYFGRDVFRFNKLFDNDFGNTVISLHQKHKLHSDITGKAYLNFTDYQYNLKLPFVGFDWSSGIKTYDVKYLLQHYFSPEITLKYGVQSQFYRFNPGHFRPLKNDSSFNEFQIAPKYAWENAYFIDANHEINNKLTFSYGMRHSFFHQLGYETINLYQDHQPVLYNHDLNYYEKAKPIGTKHYQSGETIASFHNFEPRFAVSYLTGEDHSVKASYSKTTQYIHLISNTAAATPLDIWTPSGKYIQPQIVHQYAAGFFQNFADDTYSLEIESYFKHGKNRLDYIDGAELIGNPAIEQVLLHGKTKSYGIEFLFRKNKGDFTGWVAYTWAKSLQQTAGRTPQEMGINHGKWYRTPHDRTHDLTVVAMYQISPKWHIGGNFTLQSGRPVTYPVGKYQFMDMTINDYNHRNNYSLPSFHHLDLSFTYTPHNPNKKWQREWVFSVYNVYNRKNAASINFRQNENNMQQTEAVKLSVFGIVPSVSYNFKF